MLDQEVIRQCMREAAGRGISPLASTGAGITGLPGTGAGITGLAGTGARVQFHVQHRKSRETGNSETKENLAQKLVDELKKKTVPL